MGASWPRPRRARASGSSSRPSTSPRCATSGPRARDTRCWLTSAPADIMTVATAILLLFLAPQSTGSPAPAPAGPTQPAASALQGPLFGSVPAGRPTGAPLPLSLGEAIDRALKQNLGLLLADQG